MVKYKKKFISSLEELREGSIYYAESENSSFNGLVLFLIGPDRKNYNFLPYDSLTSNYITNISDLLQENEGFTLCEVEFIDENKKRA